MGGGSYNNDVDLRLGGVLTTNEGENGVSCV
jgi:hypothetical protein